MLTCVSLSFLDNEESVWVKTLHGGREHPPYRQFEPLKFRFELEMSENEQLFEEMVAGGGTYHRNLRRSPRRGVRFG